MCGIVGAIAQREVVPILLEGLKRLEYRGYDSAGVAVVNGEACLERVRSAGKVTALEELVGASRLRGTTGIAHTRWATHGAPSEHNAHPHVCYGAVAVVHNGIIENYQALRAQQEQAGFVFTSETDTEVIAHQIYHHLAVTGDLLEAVRAAVRDLHGAFALGVISRDEPGRMVAARRGSPLVLGVGIGERFIASDIAALLPVTQRFLILEEGDIADIGRDSVRIFDRDDRPVERAERVSELRADAVERGEYRHYMLKEIFEQPRAIADTLVDRLGGERVLDEAFGPRAGELLSATRNVHIVACGTSYHAGLVARYWIEAFAGIPCSVEVASEYRYRRPVVPPGTLFVTLSQSGETADTLAALREAKTLGYLGTLGICNVPESSLVRESDLVLMTRAGPEIGVASTKAFTTQLVALMLLTLAVGRQQGMDAGRHRRLLEQVKRVPTQIEGVLRLNDTIAELSHELADKQHALFLGRGAQYPVAMEGALKLKEISYIHAEA
ncbi:MAG: glutamine--fructose-6-phosphate transaminase (isomerizing), partial [Gammaproteobacteria bacterium]|nr:glutamine--fructose-6-phosphate transaminase (isomerizing) [Gammaproteobacteria bacterium]